MIRHTFYDEVRLTTVPRYKTSELSGDEWRHSARVELMYKENVLYARSFTDMKYATAWLAWGVLDDDVSHEALKVYHALPKDYCDQPGCASKYDVKYQVKVCYHPDGSTMARQPSKPKTQQFCKRHAERGNCSREDNDDNYLLIEGTGPDGVDPKDERPSVFGGVL